MSKEHFFGLARKLKNPLLLFLAIYAAILAIPAGAYTLTGAGKAPTASTDPSRSPPPSALPSPTPSPYGSPEAPSPLPGFLDSRTQARAPSPSPGDNDSFLIYDAATGELLTVPTEDFLPAALACEMDLSSPAEALKAQAVAIYTNYTREKKLGVKEHGGQFACDSENWLVYVPEEKMRERWGEDFEGYNSLLRDICAQVTGELVTQNGEPATTAFFAISAGSTESCENVWENQVPYLQAVASPGDRLAPGYLSELSLTPQQFQAAAVSAFPDLPLDFSVPEDRWLRELTYTPSGYVDSGVLGGCTVSGADLRGAFSLRSAAFTLSLQQGSFSFRVRGWGHGVGMSQAGAAFLAKAGFNYREILSYYYPGTHIESGGSQVAETAEEKIS